MKKHLLLVLSILLVFTLTACGSDDTEDFEHNVPKEGTINVQELPYSEFLSLKNPVVTITIKEIGEIKLQLFPEQAPNTVNNFIQYIEDGVYVGNDFHRVINDFVIQAGMIDEPACNISGEMAINGFENPVLHYRGIISMARVGTDYNSGSSQWFIVEQTSSFLDTNYAPFGGMISGFTVLSYIAGLQVEDTEVPVVPIVIENITIDLKDYVPSDRVCYTE